MREMKKRWSQTWLAQHESVKRFCRKIQFSSFLSNWRKRERTPNYFYS